MARNKHPEETVNLILDVAFRLFMEKGYEHTSIQDIIDQLGGLAKGLFIIILNPRKISLMLLRAGCQKIPIESLLCSAIKKV